MYHSMKVEEKPRVPKHLEKSESIQSLEYKIYKNKVNSNIKKYENRSKSLYQTRRYGLE